MSAQKISACPYCGGGFAEINDAVEMAIRRVLADHGEVEIIRSAPALEQAGRIAALLRY